MFCFVLGAIFQIPALNFWVSDISPPFVLYGKGNISLQCRHHEFAHSNLANNFFHPGDGRRPPHPHLIVEMSFSMFACLCLKKVALACPTRCVAKMINEMSNGNGWISRQELIVHGADLELIRKVSNSMRRLVVN